MEREKERKRERKREREREAERDKETETERQRNGEREREWEREADRQTETERQRETETERQRQTETERERQRETDRQTDRETKRDREMEKKKSGQEKGWPFPQGNVVKTLLFPTPLPAGGPQIQPLQPGPLTCNQFSPFLWRPGQWLRHFGWLWSAAYTRHAPWPSWSLTYRRGGSWGRWAGVTWRLWWGRGWSRWGVRTENFSWFQGRHCRDASWIVRQRVAPGKKYMFVLLWFRIMVTRLYSEDATSNILIIFNEFIHSL